MMLNLSDPWEHLNQTWNATWHPKKGEGEKLRGDQLFTDYRECIDTKIYYVRGCYL